MRYEWKEFRLGDITEWASGGTPSKQNADFWNGTIPWISASSMRGNRYNDSDLKITQEGLKDGSRLAKKDSILLLVRGSTLHQRIPVGIATSDVAFNQDVKAINAKEEFIDPWYLLFWFMAKEKDLLNMVENTGIGAGKLDTTQLQDLLIRVPPVAERNQILLFAKALDDKIFLNRQINQTLEAMAQAIFKSWFVNFEPVKAKIAAIEAGENAEGITCAAMSAISGKTQEELDQFRAEQPYNYTQLKTTAELFPAAMQDSELGEIPEGWEVKKIGEYLNTISKTYPLKTVSEVIFLNTGDIQNGKVLHSRKSNVEILPGQAKKSIQKDDILYSEIRPENKRFAYVFFDGKEHVVSEVLPFSSLIP
jgi:type I restriction enzyme, S subunit